MIRFARFCICCALVAFPVGTPTAAPAAQEEIIDAIVAQVGGKIVLLSDVARLIGAQEEAMRQAGAPEAEIAKLRADGLERVIENRLIEIIVERAELFSTEDEVTSTIESIAAENALSVEQLYASVAYHGMTVSLYRDQIKRDLERRRAVNSMVGSQISIDEEMLLDAYNQRFQDQPDGGVAVHVRQIVVSYGQPSGRSPAKACAAVEQAYTRIQAGESFQQVASEVSEVAPQSGGDIGTFHLDEVAGWMHDALVDLEPGQTSGVLELPFGCSILELVDRQNFKPITYEEASDRLSQEIWQREMDKHYREWVEQLRADTYIDRRGFFADGGARFGGGSSTATP
jgi:parvulin-like peptidyl-prolyl isomerase